MTLSVAEVRHIAKLARLELTDSGLDATQAKLNGIFGLIEEMQAVDTDGVEPMSHP
ncbi:Asp-tRNA(Asn)/Glu-tRNA(Gln) amidotransferase subunit GatC, partial [Agrobacterium salinitolerans]|uniref:Asp-tRNA(Asn)/Glu-tRNA(Gln) amidotransferase subunit GatC n=1 Tax=Agrobacterium salinitolerans TaxID=1183413 RepID=UPI0035AFBC11